jgi:hypothetical protein
MKKKESKESLSIYASRWLLRLESRLGIDWLLRMGQAKFSGRTRKEQAADFLARLHHDVDHPVAAPNRKSKNQKPDEQKEELRIIPVPGELIRRFRWPLYQLTQEDIATGADLGELRKPDDDLLNDVADFMSGLTSFVKKLKENGLRRIGSLKSPKEREIKVDSKGRSVSVYKWENSGDIAGNLIIDLMEYIKASESSLRFCEQGSCKNLYFQTYSQRKYCSDRCGKIANQKLKQKNPKYNEYRKLFNQKKYWLTKKIFPQRKSSEEILNELAKHWRKKNVSEERIKQLLFPENDEPRNNNK